MQTWMTCALKKFESQRKPEILLSPIQVLKKQVTLLDRGPWKSALTVSWVKSHQGLWELSLEEKKEKKRNQLQKELRESLFMRSELLSSEQKFYYAGWESGVSFSKVKMSFPPEDFNSEKFLDEKIQSELDQKNSLKALELMLSHLKKFPVSSSGKKWKDKIIEIWSDALEKENVDREKMMSLLLDSDPERLAEWASWAHRRANYKEAVILAERALQNLKGASALNSLFNLARSQLFLGQYEDAKKNLEALSLQYSSTEEAAEALFRLGLLHYRLGNYSLARQSFERLLGQGREKFELNTRYWWVRSLEGLKESKGLDEKKRLVDDYPYSYYALKLKSELQMIAL